MLQEWIVGLLILGAAGYLGRAALRMLFGSADGCGSSCGGCGKSQVPVETAAAIASRRISLPQV